VRVANSVGGERKTGQREHSTLDGLHLIDVEQGGVVVEANLGPCEVTNKLGRDDTNAASAADEDTKFQPIVKDLVKHLKGKQILQGVLKR
jgi:hypothetical protein